MKQKYISLLLGIALLLAITIGVNQYFEKQRYERYLSLQVANDFSELSSAIINNQRIYSEILTTNEISFEQAESLYKNNYAIVRLTQNYQNLARLLKFVSDSELSNLPTNNASSIAYFFEHLIWGIGENEGLTNKENRVFHLPFELAAFGSFQLEDIDIEKIDKIRQLNELWVNVLTENITGVSSERIVDPDIYFETYKETAVKSRFWLDVVAKMDEVTKKFLDENYLEDISAILY